MAQSSQSSTAGVPTDRLRQALRFNHWACSGAATLFTRHAKRSGPLQTLTRELSEEMRASSSALVEMMNASAWRAPRRRWRRLGMALWGEISARFGESFRLAMLRHGLLKATLIHRTTAARAREAGREDVAAEMERRERAAAALLASAVSFEGPRASDG